MRDGAPPRGRARLLVIAAGALAVGVSALVLGTSSSGCIGHQCDFSIDDYGGDGGGGELVPNKRDEWETSPSVGKWISYRHNHTVKLHPKEFDGRTIDEVRVYISGDEQPNSSENALGANFGKNYTLAGGNLAQVTDFGTEIWVNNGTCADFFARIVITAVPLAPNADGGAPEAGDAAPILDAGEGGN